MTDTPLREQASERLTDEALWCADASHFAAKSCGEDGWARMRESMLDALQPLFDQVEREKAEAAAEVLRLMRVFNDDSVARERDDLRAKLTQAEADRDRWSDMADKLHAQVANQRAALDRG